MLINITKTKIRLLLWGGFTLLMLFVMLPLFFFFYLFDEAKIKQSLVNEFANDGYVLQISGNIIPKMWHGMSFDISNILLQNKSSNNELIKIDRMSCKLSWLYLIMGQYRFNRMEIDGVGVNQNYWIKYGMQNIIKLFNSQSINFSNIEKIDIRHLDSTGTNNLYAFKDGNLSIEENSTGLNFKFGVKVDNTYYLLNGHTFPVNNNFNFDTLNLRVYNHAMNINLNSQATYYADTQTLNISRALGGITLNNYIGDIMINDATLNVNNFNANGVTLKVNFANNLSQNQILFNVSHMNSVDYKSFSIDKLSSQYKMDIADMSVDVDSKFEDLFYAANTGLSSKCFNQLTINAPEIYHDTLNALLNGTCEYSGLAHSYAFHGNGNLNNSPLTLSISTTNISHKPHILLNAGLDTLDLSKIQQYTESKSIGINKLPFNWLSYIDLQSNISINELMLGKFIFQKTNANLMIMNNQLSISHFTTNIYNGNINGDLTLKKTNDDAFELRTNQKVHKLNLKTFLNDALNVNAINGVADVSLRASVLDVKNYYDLLRKINADVEVKAYNGSFDGIDFNLFANPPSSPNISNAHSTVFNNMNARFKFSNGISKHGMLQFSSSYVIAQGSGDINFINNLLDYNLKIKSVLPKNNQRIKSVVIPVNINGPILNPKIKIQNVELIKGMDRKIKKNQYTHRI